MPQFITTLDLTLTTGLDFEPSVTWEHEDASPYDLTGYTARAEVRPGPGDSALILAFDSEPDTGALGRIELGGPAGTIALFLDRADTWAVSRGGVIELWLYPPDATAEPVPFSTGTLTLDKTVMRTRPAVTA